MDVLKINDDDDDDDDLTTILFVLICFKCSARSPNQIPKPDDTLRDASKDHAMCMQMTQSI